MCMHEHMHEHMHQGTYSLTSRQLEVTEIMLHHGCHHLSFSLSVNHTHSCTPTHNTHACLNKHKPHKHTTDIMPHHNSLSPSLKHTHLCIPTHNTHVCLNTYKQCTQLTWCPNMGTINSLPLSHISTLATHTHRHTHPPHVTHRHPHTHLCTSAHTGTHTHTQTHRTHPQEYSHCHWHILAHTETDQQAAGSWWGNATPWVPPAPPGHCLSQRTKHHCSVHPSPSPNPQTLILCDLNQI